VSNLVLLALCVLGVGFLIYVLAHWRIESRRTVHPKLRPVDIEETIGKVRRRIAMNRMHRQQ
jgi:hypothetical protein